MAALTELEGRDLGTERIIVERGPVKVFASAVKDGDPVYLVDGAPVPPTFPFCWSWFGSVQRSGSAGLPIAELRGPGRMILHGEQEFIYHRWPRVGDVLESKGRISEVHEKPKSNGGSMEFYVTDTDWNDAATGEPVVTTRFTLIVNVSPPR